MYVDHFDFAIPLLATVDALFAPAECRRLLDGVHAATWLAATVNAAQGRVVNDRLRNSETAIVRDDALADALFARIRGHVPATIAAVGDHGRRAPVAVVDVYRPLRIYRYLPGQHFGLHQDQAYRRADGARSLLTLMVYLDDDCDGGETDFPEQGRRIRPRTGDALWFQHRLLHAGLPVTRGVKHVLRTDVLYTRPA